MGRHGPRLLVGGLRVCYKLQLDNRTTPGRNGVAPDRSWDTGPSYAYNLTRVGGSTSGLDETATKRSFARQTQLGARLLAVRLAR